ncbi:MAG: methylenetetrahydrofolate--tRNA-(uracil(54)-C(5))-methyltransferase (FADH(2)-oxidizing) TrmFO [Desulfobulbaceae bacterium]|uniref:Methylenetetrahydrofolate--tRNA-(uracil-5-)-methyltransferase TrmFO n=1 Tax=Candidatus Desulfatifera sulfidica TaxID=2841691 RepID=A0A8J6N6S0_9BACT|nr:methylenetetrahydrofolate--tRNA-(uracil(54)-C(5))-methyltransferase (FADH(2)-oxidizing) TrmFO [Candidatus Desulfatifera sulfidica]
MTQKITIIGGGLAGCEAAWQAAERGCQVTLYDMKPQRLSPAHHSPLLAELVCSNSLRSNAPTSAVGLLKEEMRRLDSLLMRVADATAVPAGQALAVDREQFSTQITEALKLHPRITVIREEVLELPPPEGQPVILATGPLTSESMTEALINLTGRDRLAFYDAIAPIIVKESLDMEIVYQKSRWDDDNPGDYLNCAMDRLQYENFLEALKAGKTVPLKDFEEAKYFEGCLPIEVMAERGNETLRFGPMKPVGLRRPNSDITPHAVVQLRQENHENTLYNMVGFQTKLTYGEQKRIFRMIPGMEKAEFARLGSLHRNTFICAPELLEPTLQLKTRPDLFLAGQLSGVEGYVESTAMGLLAGINAARMALGQSLVSPPPDTSLGALITHLTKTDPGHFQPSNVNFGLFPPWEKKVPKKLRGELRAEISLASLAAWKQEMT